MQTSAAPIGQYGHGSHRVAEPLEQPREMSGLGWGALVSLGVAGLLELGRLASSVGLRSAAGGGGSVSGAHHAYIVWNNIFGLAALVTAGVFISWFYRAYRNLRRLGVQNLRYGPGWAIGAWFVPILSLFRPKQIANDIWRGSERGVEVSVQWRQVEVPALIHWWWGLFLTQWILSWISSSVTASGYHKLTTSSFAGGTPEAGLSQIKTGTAVDILASITGIAAVVVAIMVVSRVSRRLDLVREDALAAGPAAMPVQPFPGAAMAPQMVSASTWPTAPTSGPPSQPPPSPAAVAMPPMASEERIQCPQCAEWILPQAKLCRFCGHRLEPARQ
jgi:Domain of unknown function (DUF4328)